jgi:DNA topoisomerase-1
MSSDTLTAESANVDGGSVGLSYVCDEHLGISREKQGASFRYVGTNGSTIRDRKVLQRIRGIIIPPAWTDVWICLAAKDHIQATGRDDRGRKQYRYHPDFSAVRDGNG